MKDLVTGKEYKYSKSDYLKNKQCIYSDGSEIKFAKDDSFCWYRTAGKYDNYYYYGTYLCYRGEDACNYAVAMGIIEEKNLNEYFESTKGDEFYRRENTFVLVVENEYIFIDGQKQKAKDEKRKPISVYYGFFDGQAGDTVNVNTGNSQRFIIEK